MSNQPSHFTPSAPIPRAVVIATLTALTAALAGCGTATTVPPRAEQFIGITDQNVLVSFNAGQPGIIVARRPVTGLAMGETIGAIDFRPANGRLYAMSSTARLYTIDTATGAAARVGATDATAFLKSPSIGLDFNPTVDRIRLVGSNGENMRLHPDTGAVVDGNPTQEGVQIDGPLTYAAGDSHAGRKAVIAGAAYTNSQAGAKTTTNFVIDAAAGTLATQGTREGAATPVSPNTGQLFTIGTLGVPVNGTVSFDIAPSTNTGFIAVSPAAGRTMLYQVDLSSGRARALGSVSETLTAMAIAP